ncbi:MAG: DUF4252 domain-containing protein [Prevotella sp.]|nr:DUF4252 domain-containing protein [Prevotella sp.]MBO7537895.1 DUF4252 domain-containing protein [Prevotella sp.]
MKHTLLLKLALCAAILLTSAGADASNKDFKKLAKIDGVEHVHIGKLLLNLAAKNGGDINFGEDISISDKSGNVLKKIDTVDVYTCEEKNSAEQLSQQVRSILDGEGWEPLIDATDGEGYKSKIYQNHHGKHTTVIIFAEEDGEASLVVIDGKLDMAQLMEQMSKED